MKPCSPGQSVTRVTLWAVPKIFSNPYPTGLLPMEPLQTGPAPQVQVLLCAPFLKRRKRGSGIEFIEDIGCLSSMAFSAGRAYLCTVRQRSFTQPYPTASRVQYPRGIRLVRQLRRIRGTNAAWSRGGGTWGINTPWGLSRAGADRRGRIPPGWKAGGTCLGRHPLRPTAPPR